METDSKLKRWLLKYHVDRVMFISAGLAICALFFYNFGDLMLSRNEKAIQMIIPEEIQLKRVLNFTVGNLLEDTNMTCDGIRCIEHRLIWDAQHTLLSKHYDALPFICTSMLDIPIKRELPWFCTIIKRSDQSLLSGRRFRMRQRRLTTIDYNIFSPYFNRNFTGTVPQHISVWADMKLDKVLNLDNEDAVWYFIMQEVIH